MRRSRASTKPRSVSQRSEKIHARDRVRILFYKEAAQDKLAIAGVVRHMLVRKLAVPHKQPAQRMT